MWLVCWCCLVVGFSLGEVCDGFPSCSWSLMEVGGSGFAVEKCCSVAVMVVVGTGATPIDAVSC